MVAKKRKDIIPPISPAGWEEGGFKGAISIHTVVKNGRAQTSQTNNWNGNRAEVFSMANIVESFHQIKLPTRFNRDGLLILPGLSGYNHTFCSDEDVAVHSSKHSPGGNVEQ
jgi:hypothetical protein